MPGPWEQYAATPAAAPPGPWSKYSAPADRSGTNATTAPDTPVSHQEFWDSVNHTLIQPIADTFKDVAARGGISVTNDIIQGLLDQTAEFAKSASTGLDVRKLPIIGTGAVATTERVKEQIAAGNYRGAAGSVLGYLAPFAAPEAIARTPEAAAAVGDAVSSTATKLRDALPDAVPNVPATARDVIGVISPRAAHAVALANKGAKVANAVLDATKAPELDATQAYLEKMKADAAARPEPEWVSPADQAGREQMAARVYNANAGSGPWTQYSQLPPAAATPAAATPAIVTPALPAAAPFDPTPYLGYQAKESDFMPAPRVAPAAPEPAVPAPAAAPPVAQTPELSAAQRIEDAADDQAARMRMNAQDIEWANRQHKADRFAAYLLKNKLDPLALAEDPARHRPDR